MSRPIKPYFCSSPDGGITFYATEQEALDAAKEEIQNYLDDTWCDEVTGVIVGKVSHRATETNVMKRQGELDDDGLDEAGDYWEPDIEFTCDYQMLPLEDVSIITSQPTETGNPVSLKAENAI